MTSMESIQLNINLLQLLNRLMDYADHTQDCNLNQVKRAGICTCGFRELYRDMTEVYAAAQEPTL